MFAAAYSQRDDLQLGSMVRHAIRLADLTEKEIYLGRCDGAQWVRMLNGQAALDLRVLCAVLPWKVWLMFLPLFIAALTRRFMEQKQEAA